MKKWIAIAATAVLALITAACAAAPAEESAKADKPAKAAEELVTAEMVVDLTVAQNPASIRQFCKGLGILGPKLSFKSYKAGYGDGPPSARAVFDETASRC